MKYETHAALELVIFVRLGLNDCGFFGAETHRGGDAEEQEDDRKE